MKNLDGIPYIEGRNNVTYKMIVFSDTELEIYVKGEKLKITSVFVEENSLEICIKSIIAMNFNEIFHTIQYSRKYKEVSFYTNNSIIVDGWEKFDNVIGLMNMYQKVAIVNYTEEILKRGRISNKDCIALYDVVELIKNKLNTSEKIQCDLTDVIAKKIRLLNELYQFCYIEMEYETFELKMIIEKRFVLNSNEIFYFKKDNNSLYVSRHEGYEWLGDDILEVCDEELSKLYDVYLNNKDKLLQKSDSIITVNSSYRVNISCYSVEIFLDNITGIRINISDLYLFSRGELKLSKLRYPAVLEERRTQILNNLFVRISDCPKWMQEELCKLRKEQLVKEGRKQKIDLVKLKISKFFRKIFRFAK